jgi:beta-catenin-like protein 1
MGFNPALSSKLVIQTHLMTWLLKRIQAKSHDENRAYAAELLSILLQNRNENRLVLSENDGIEIILKVLSVILNLNRL